MDYVRFGKIRRGGHPLGGCACVTALWGRAEILICRQGLNELLSNSLPTGAWRLSLFREQLY